MTIQSPKAVGDQLQLVVAVKLTWPAPPLRVKNWAVGVAEKGQGMAPGQNPLASAVGGALETLVSGWPMAASRRVGPLALAPPPPATTACLRLWVDCKSAAGAKLAV